MSEQKLSHITIDAVNHLQNISSEDAKTLPQTTVMFLEHSADWERDAYGGWRRKRGD